MSNFTIDTNDLTEFNKIGIAFSGGLDSTVLLKTISDSDIPNNRLTALHVNHGISKDCDKWEEFCKEMAFNLGIDFKSWKLGEIKKISEESLRQKRYESFGQWANKDDVIITGHHLDDQTETVLFRILRGTGLKGLEGIKKFSTVNDLNFYRPFLKKTKGELLNYAEEHNLVWVEDQTNQESKFSRNIIRNDLIPTINERWPFVNQSIEKLSNRAEKAQKILLEIAREDLQKVETSEGVIDLKKFQSYSSERQENIIFFWLNHQKKLRVPSLYLAEILSALEGPSEGSSTFHIHSKDKEVDLRLIISSNEIRILNSNLCSVLPKDLSIDWNLKDTLQIPSGKLSLSESYGKGLDTKYLDFGATIKARVGGERCKPYGRNKSQKIKNLFQEFEVPDWKRDYIPIIYINEKIAAVGDLWVCEDFHTSLDKKGISIIWNQKNH